MKKIGFAALMLALAGAVFLTPKVFAATSVGVPYSQGTLPIVRRITNVGSGVKDAMFTYSLTASENNPAPVSGYQVTTKAGGSAVANSANAVDFSCTLNLRNMRFSKVGDYVFTLSETASSDATNFPIDTNKFDLYFQVTNVLGDNGEPTGELQVNMLDQIYDYAKDAKVSKQALFVSEANYTYITLTNKVNGAAADTDQYFKYKVSIDGMNANSTVSVIGQDSEVEYGGNTITTDSSYAFNSDSDLYVYLKHGQEVVIGQNNSRGSGANELPQGVSYTIEKVDDDESYTTTIDSAEVASISKETVALGADDFAEKNTTLAVNSKDATVNTGVFANAWPFLVIAAFSISGFVISRRISRSL